MAAIGTHAPGGLAIDQLLKLVASGRITAEKYAELTGDIPGANAELPVLLDEAAAPAPAPELGSQGEYQCIGPQPLQVCSLIK